MKELYNNTPSELLNLYVDGELPASMEPHLFDQLSQNEELQSEMRDLMSIRDAVRNDTESFTPPVAAHRGIFDSLGFIYPGGVAPLAVQTVSKFRAFLSKTWLPVLSAVVASLITTVVVYDVINKESATAETASKSVPVVSSFESNVTANVVAPVADDIVSSNVTVKKSAPVTSGFNNQNTESNIGAPIVVEETAPVFNVNNINAGNNVSNIFNASFVVPGNKASMFNPASNGQSMFTPQNINISNRFSDNFLPYEAKGYRVMVRFNNARSFDIATHYDYQFSTFENFSIGFVTGDGDLKLGVEVGQEAFAQSFQAEEDGILYEVEQNPLIFWGAFLARYENEGLKIFDIQPFAQISLGASQLGPLGRVIVGAQYVMPQAFYGTKLGIQLGYESAGLVYQNQSEWKSSTKSGFNFGMSLHF